MKRKQAPKSERLALFSENDRKYLHGKRIISDVSKAQLHRKLDQRFEALLDDLAILQKSPQLEFWRSSRFWKYDVEIREAHYFSNLFSKIRLGFTGVMKRTSKGKGKNKIFLYWLHLIPINTDLKKINRNIFNPSYFFQFIRTGLTEQDKELFLKAYRNHGILPNKKEMAISLNEIRKRLSGKSIIRTNEETIKISKNTFQDPRNIAINKIRKRYFVKINKVLKKFDSYIIQMKIQTFSE